MAVEARADRLAELRPGLQRRSTPRGRHEPLPVVPDEGQQLALLLLVERHFPVPMKKMASTLFRFGPPLASSPVVFCGVFEMMCGRYGCRCRRRRRLIPETLDDGGACETESCCACRCACRPTRESSSHAGGAAAAAASLSAACGGPPAAPARPWAALRGRRRRLLRGYKDAGDDKCDGNETVSGCAHHVLSDGRPMAAHDTIPLVTGARRNGIATVTAPNPARNGHNPSSDPQAERTRQMATRDHFRRNDSSRQDDRARAPAMTAIESYDQPTVDRLCRAVAWATANEVTATRLAQMSVDESGMGSPAEPPRQGARHPARRAPAEEHGRHRRDSRRASSNTPSPPE